MNATDNRGRHYWVVSPNVKRHPKTVEHWKKASIEHCVAFMGYWPDEVEHGQMGRKFAGVTEPHIPSIKPDDVILIARRHELEPDLVGFGVVHGKYARNLKGFKPPEGEEIGSLRKLKRFKHIRKLPSGIPFKEVLRFTKAMVQLHPEDNGAHRRVCEWMERRLGRSLGERRRASSKPRTQMPGSTEIGPLPSNPQLYYMVKTRGAAIRAKRSEARLLKQFQRWLEKKGRKLIIAKYGRLQCDAYESPTRNLIEAKSSTKREHIRMAVGELLDYAFQGKRKFGNPHKAILLPKKPNPDSVKWLRPLKIHLIWRRGDEFFDDANRQFS